MLARNIDNDSKLLSDTQEGDVPRLGNAAVHELKQIRAEALRDIDEGGFSCVASIPPSSPSTSVHRHGALSRLHLKLCFVAGTGFLRDA
jgi:hypothetical protein